MNVGIFVYDQAEVLDFSGPFEVFSTASRICEKETPFTTFLVGETGQEINARGGFRITPAYDFHNSPRIDLLIVVGGVHTNEMEKKAVVQWIQDTAASATVVASVCTGIFLLAKAGVVSNHSVTTHWEDIGDLKAAFPDLNVQESKRWVVDGSILTSAGISAGMDMSLHLVSTVYSKMLAEKTATQMDYQWNRIP